MELAIELASQDEALFIFGAGDAHLRQIRDGLEIQVAARNGVIRIEGDEGLVRRAEQLLKDMAELYKAGDPLPDLYIESRLARIKADDARERGGAEEPGSSSAKQRKLTPQERATVRSLARSEGQEGYIEAIIRNELIFCSGPAGTGKTYLAVRLAVDGLRSGDYQKLILCRPAVEAGEKLGFLPGDFQAKVNPYLQPLYDALNDVLGMEQVKRYIEREIIEIIPLAYMRGRTLNNSFIILDEGQNTTVSQMKMFLTRLGLGSKVVANGDVTQFDLPEDQLSGLVHAAPLMKDIHGIAWVELEKMDIVRHPLVKKIVEAYEAVENNSTPKDQ
jgi:phosphate starvation-inducible PhoH-like protein|tara:strand:+ start:892 stop:1887 length:996 start_codon:yes stop_codon:yes gene_type:complete